MKQVQTCLYIDIEGQHVTGRIIDCDIAIGITVISIETKSFQTNEGRDIIKKGDFLLCLNRKAYEVGDSQDRNLSYQESFNETMQDIDNGIIICREEDPSDMSPCPFDA